MVTIVRRILLSTLTQPNSGNNPCIFESDWRELETKIRYLQHTMHVSAYRIAMTPNSLTRDLEFFKLR